MAPRQISKAILKEFAAATSTERRAIAEREGIPVGTLYNHTAAMRGSPSARRAPVNGDDALMAILKLVAAGKLAPREAYKIIRGLS
jgi:hypothetical protein